MSFEVEAQGREITMRDLEDLLRSDYEANGRRSTFRIAPIFRHLRAHFGERPLEDFRPKVEGYQAARRAEGASNATIRNELTLMGRAFRLACRREEMAQVPFIPKPAVRNAREGFVTEEAFTEVRLRLPHPIDSLAIFAYVTGWRRAEVTRLRWSEVDMETGVVRLSGSRSKNGHARTFPFSAHRDLRRLMDQLSRERNGEYVFHRKGKPIADFRVVWKNRTR